jgi:hypothetical protein
LALDIILVKIRLLLYVTCLNWFLCVWPDSNKHLDWFTTIVGPAWHTKPNFVFLATSNVFRIQDYIIGRIIGRWLYCQPTDPRTTTAPTCFK